MKTIWKNLLEVADVQKVELPEGAEILTVQTQHEHPCIWALVDTAKPMINFKIGIAGTGNDLELLHASNETLKYIGTFQKYAGDFIFHVFLIEKK